MPLVRICLMQGKSVEFRHKLGEIVYQTIVDTINVLPKGNFQIITEHDEISLVEVKKERCDSETGLLNKRSGPLGLKSYKYLDTLTKKPIISTAVLTTKYFIRRHPCLPNF
jgi:hypothetical protein